MFHPNLSQKVKTNMGSIHLPLIQHELKINSSLDYNYNFDCLILLYHSNRLLHNFTLHHYFINHYHSIIYCHSTKLNHPNHLLYLKIIYHCSNNYNDHPLKLKHCYLYLNFQFRN